MGASGETSTIIAHADIAHEVVNKAALEKC